MHLNNQRGDALILSMIFIAVGILLLSSLTMKALDLAKAEKSSRTISQGDLFINSLHLHLSDPASCLAAFGNSFNYSNISGGAYHNITLQTKLPKSSGGTINLNSNENLGNNLVVEKIELKDSGLPSLSVPITLPPPNPEIIQLHNTAILKVSLKQSNSDVALKPVEIPITILSEAGILKSCAANDASTMACSESGGIWVPGNPLSKRCIPRNHCRSLGSYSETGSVNSFVNPETNAASCPTGSIAYQNGIMNIPSSCGKSCVQNNYFRTYECLACGTYTAVANTAGNTTGSKAENPGDEEDLTDLNGVNENKNYTPEDLKKLAEDLKKLTPL